MQTISNFVLNFSTEGILKYKILLLSKTEYAKKIQKIMQKCNRILAIWSRLRNS